MKRLTLLLLVLISPSLWAQSYSFGLVPQQNAAKLAELWNPIFDYLSEQTGDEYRFATAPDIPTFEQRLLAGEYDVAYMNPYHLTVFAQKPGYVAIAKQAQKKLKGIIVVPKDSSIADISELDGQEVAFPSPAAFAASVIPRAYLQSQGISINPVYVSSHDSVYLTVNQGLFVAGGGVQRTFANIDPSVSENLKVLWTTQGYTPHAFAVHPEFDEQAKLRLQQALVDMANNEQGKALLAAIKFAGIEAGEDKDWDDVRSLGITLLDHLLEP